MKYLWRFRFCDYKPERRCFCDIDMKDNILLKEKLGFSLPLFSRTQPIFVSLRVPIDTLLLLTCWVCRWFVCLCCARRCMYYTHEPWMIDEMKSRLFLLLKRPEKREKRFLLLIIFKCVMRIFLIIQRATKQVKKGERGWINEISRVIVCSCLSVVVSTLRLSKCARHTMTERVH